MLRKSMPVFYYNLIARSWRKQLWRKKWQTEKQNSRRRDRISIVTADGASPASAQRDTPRTEKRACIHTDRRKGNRSVISSLECGRDNCSVRLITQAFISTRRHWRTEKREKRHWRFPKNLGSGERTEVMRHDRR